MEELRPLWTFMHVARLGTLSAAASALSLSSAAVSKGISKLEKQLKTQLFSRSGGRLQLTGEGQHLYEQVAPSLGHIQAALVEVRQRHGQPSGTVRLSAVTLFGRTHVIPLLPQFFARFPEINVVLSLHDSARGLSRHGYEVRINWGEEPEQGKVAHQLLKMPLVLVASPDYLARRGTPTTPSDLAQHDCICAQVNSQPRTMWLFTRSATGRRKPAAVESFVPLGRITIEDELEAVATAAIAGLGVTLISADSVVAELTDGSLVRLLPNYSTASGDARQTEIILQHPTRNRMSPAAAALVDFLLERLKQPAAS